MNILSREEYRSSFKEYMTVWNCAYCGNQDDITVVFKKSMGVRCNVCGLYRNYPRINIEGQRKVLELLSESFNLPERKADNIRSIETPRVIEGYNPAIFTIKKYAPDIFKGGTALDVGTLTGEMVAALKIAGAKAVGLEPEEPVVNVGLSHGLDIRIGTFDTRTMGNNFEHHSFDLISFMESIAYMQDWAEVFRLVRMYLKHDGTIYIKTSNPRSLHYRRYKTLDSRKFYHGGLADKKALTYILKKEEYYIHEIGYWYENIFRTLGYKWLENNRIMKSFNTLVIPLIRGLDMGDRIYMCAGLRRGR